MKYEKYIKIKICGKVLLLGVLIAAIISLIKVDAYKINAATENYKDKMIRFHVLANSDIEEDQALKLKVRDEVIAYLHPKLLKSNTVEESEKIIQESYSNLIDISKEVIKENGYNYDVSVNLEYCNFPTKQYSSVVLPSGEYKALRVVIGEGSGQNWWCVMFPPLCFVDESTSVIDEETDLKLQEILTEDEYNLVVKKEDKEIQKTEFKFKVFEVLDSLENLF